MSIPVLVQPSWKFIRNEVVNVHASWKIHEQLFAKGDKRMELLMETSANFFALIQETLLLSIQLTISKLGDKAKSGGFENLNLAKLANEIDLHDPEADETIKANFNHRLREILEDFTTLSRDVRERRNKFLTHLDYDVALNIGPTPLAGVSRKEIENALESLRKFMHSVEAYFGEDRTLYKNPVLTWDGDLLVSSLILAKRYSELEKNGTVEYLDWRKSPWADA